MKIAHLISSYLPAGGGAQICVHNIAKRHAQKGHEVTVITPHEYLGGKNWGYQMTGLKKGTVFFLNRAFALGRWNLVRQLEALQTKHRFDLWQVTVGYPFGVAAVDFFKKQNIPCVLRCTGFDIQIDPEIGYGVRLNPRIDGLIRTKYPQFDRFVAISQTMKYGYRELGIPEESIALIPNGVDISRFERPVGRELIRAQWGIKDQKVLLTVGRNHPKKGFHFIPEILKRLTEKRKDMVWIVVGDGSQEIKELAVKQGVGHFIRASKPLGLGASDGNYPGQDIIDIYKSADLFVLPTIIETFGIVVIEAMAAGLPVITTTAPGVDELIEQGKTGFKSKPGDVAGMTQNIERLLSDENFYHDIQSRVRMKSREYDWDAVADRYLALYEMLIR